jgi:pyrimidine deaminase RibD-like protein
VKPSGQIEDGADCSGCDGVVVSHGANQVNATRDATRHAELVAIDRMLTGGLSSDRQRLPPGVLARSARGRIPEDNPLLREATSGGVDDVAPACTINGWNDAWMNVPDDKDHWKNGYGWGSGRLYDADIFKRCDLYVTCEPCIMVSGLAIEVPQFFLRTDECYPPKVLLAY